MENKKVLIIDDEQAVLNFLYVLLVQSGKFESETLRDSTLAYEKLKNNNYDLILLDMDMPDVTGLDILNYIQKNDIDVETIVLTGVEDVELAVSAMKAGAYDYLKKPVDNELMLLTMERALERKSMRQEIEVLKTAGSWKSLKNKEAFEGIMTQNPRMIQIFKFVEKIAPTNTSVLIMGESGTGKELVARAIHKAGARKDKKFIAVNAGAFAKELFASEFFGHIKGAFSGAHTNKKGFLNEADNGTLFLDEIGELPLEQQVKLLRVLQNGEFFPVGSTRPMRTDIRLLAATNKNLWEEMERGSFRKDLFYRLNMNTVSLPPLREREGDIPLLTGYFLQTACRQHGKNIKKVSSEVLTLLESHSFPGNVRELANIINSAVVMEQEQTLTKKSLPVEFLNIVEKLENKPTKENKPDNNNSTLLSLEDMEKRHIEKVLESTDGNRTYASKTLGISRATLISKIKKYGL
ncbi:MAG: sigma-54 dependent transcriptional regulator [Candidatus Eremiobacteraeota bacterium]|nr:sigma-54 dependent transcriptional regulator [Candidatus Eremiobacteraeota bacterium]